MDLIPVRQKPSDVSAKGIVAIKVMSDDEYVVEFKDGLASYQTTDEVVAILKKSDRYINICYIKETMDKQNCVFCNHPNGKRYQHCPICND